ncbi:hypothetical protein MMC25_001197 [Agyrium rufum]|nr:hypothetical protein [Agyrium rufum]
MSTPFLYFLYPPLIRNLAVTSPRVVASAGAASRKLRAQRGFRSVPHRREEAIPKRYGPAVEQKLDSAGKKAGEQADGEVGNIREDGKGSLIKDDVEVTAKKEDIKPKQDQKAPSSKSPSPKSASKDTPATDNTSPPPKPAIGASALADAVSSTINSSDATPTTDLTPSSLIKNLEAEAEKQKQEASSIRDSEEKPLQTVLQVEAPTAATNPEHEHKPPHLHAPPYVHHFDTYSLVKDLEKGGFSLDLSVTLMKAVRGLLAINMDVAKEGLVSKSDVENETYLFRAACSELRTEISNSRRSASEKQRTERAHLQHEVDILNQRLSQESVVLKDELRGMFDDRKMSVRMEQRGMESSLQELNYKITVRLNSDTRGEVEGLRWVLTRRAAMAIAGMACSLRYASYKVHEQEKEKQAEAAAAASNPFSGYSSSGSGPSYTVPSRDSGTQTSDSAALSANLDSGLG